MENDLLKKRERYFKIGAKATVPKHLECSFTEKFDQLCSNLFNL